jgi:hypothetical protein
MRSENELSEKYNELIQAIKDRKWENALELRQQIEKLGLQLGLKEDVCQPVLTELKNAIKYLFKNEKYVSEKTKRQIFEFCEQTTLFQAAIETLTEQSITSADHWNLALYLLSQNRNDDRLDIIAARSYIINKFIKSKDTIFQVLSTGPVLFLSDESTIINAPWYQAARLSFISILLESGGEDVFKIMQATPFRLPSDAGSFFTKAKPADQIARGQIKLHIQRCPDSEMKKNLMSLFT